jgi:hypothetical protein
MNLNIVDANDKVTKRATPIAIARTIAALMAAAAFRGVAAGLTRPRPSRAVMKDAAVRWLRAARPVYRDWRLNKNAVRASSSCTMNPLEF